MGKNNPVTVAREERKKLKADGGYVVQNGDSWESIAGQMGGDQRKFQYLANKNGGADRMLQPGDVINIPGGFGSKWSNPPYVSPTSAAYQGMSPTFDETGKATWDYSQLPATYHGPKINQATQIQIAPISPPLPTFSGSKGYTPSYWEDPTTVNRWYTWSQSNPGKPLPGGIDPLQLQTAYEWFAYKNPGKTPDQWGFLSSNDPARNALQSMVVPPAEYLTAKEQAAQYNKFPSAKQTAIKPISQAGLKPGDIGYDWTNVPAWQKTMFDLMSDPGVAPALMGGAMGGAGGVAMGYGLGVLGKASQDAKVTGSVDVLNLTAWEQWLVKKFMGAIGGNQDKYSLQVDNPLLLGGLSMAEKGLEVMNALSQGTEQVVGTASQAIDYARNNEQDGFDWKAAWEAGKMTYEAEGANMMVPAMNIPPAVEWGLQRISKIFGNNDKWTNEDLKFVDYGQVWKLGEANPVTLEQGNNVDKMLSAIREDLQAPGANPEQVAAQWRDTFGLSGIVSDMVIQAAADPLNKMGEVETFVGRRVADATGNIHLAMAFAKVQDTREAGLFGALKEFKATSNTIRVSEGLTGFERMIAGISDANKIAALDPSSTPKTVFDRFKQAFVELTPGTKAVNFLNMANDNLSTLADASRDENGSIDPHLFGQHFNAVADMEYQVGEGISSSILDSPEGYTIQPAMRAAKDLINEKVMLWDTLNMAGGPIETLYKVAKALNISPDEVIRVFRNKSEAGIDFGRLIERARASGDEAALALVKMADDGLITPDSLKSALNVFEQPGIPHSSQEWFGGTMDALNNHFGRWLSDYYKLAPDHWFFRSAATLKSAQSLLLLGFNPQYAINNFVNNIATRAAEGIGGYIPPWRIKEFLNEFGITPSRLDEGIGPAEIGGNKLKPGADVIADSLTAKGTITQIQRGLRQVSKLGVFSRLSGVIEKAESAQAFVIAMRDHWGRTWKPGVGFKRMDPALEAAINSKIPGGADMLYHAIQDGMNQQHIENILVAGSINENLHGAMQQVSSNLGIPLDQVNEMFQKTGTLDDLTKRLSKAGTPQEKLRAFDATMKKAHEWLDSVASNEFRVNASKTAERIKGEQGSAAAAEEWLNVQIAVADRWQEGVRSWSDTMQQLTHLSQEEQRAYVLAQRAREHSNWDRTNNFSRSTMMGIFQAWGVGDTDVRDFQNNLKSSHTTWDDAYKAKETLQDEFFTNLFAGKANPGDWDILGATINALFETAFKRDVSLQKTYTELVTKVITQKFGKPAGDIFYNAYKEVGNWRLSMWEQQREFIQSTKALRKAERDIEWQKFNESKIGWINDWKQRSTDAINKALGFYQSKPVPPQSSAPVEVPPTNNPAAGLAEVAPPINDPAAPQAASVPPIDQPAAPPAAGLDVSQPFQDNWDNITPAKVGAQQEIQRIAGIEFGIGSKGFDNEILRRIINANLPENRKGITSLNDVTVDEARAALQAHVDKHANKIDVVESGLYNLGYNQSDLLNMSIQEKKARLESGLTANQHDTFDAIQSKPISNLDPVIREPIRQVLSEMLDEVKAGRKQSLAEWIKEHHGIQIPDDNIPGMHLRDITGEPKVQKEWGVGLFVKKGGMNWDDVVRAMIDEYFITPGEVDNPSDPGGYERASELIKKMLRKENVTPFNQEAKLDALPAWYESLKGLKNKQSAVQMALQLMIDGQDKLSFGMDPSATDRAIKSEAFDRLRERSVYDGTVGKMMGVEYSWFDYKDMLEQAWSRIDTFADDAGYLKSLQDVISDAYDKAPDDMPDDIADLHREVNGKLYEAIDKANLQASYDDMSTQIAHTEDAGRVEMSASALRELLISKFGYDETSAEANVTLVKARANVWSKITGQSPDQWFSRTFEDILGADEALPGESLDQRQHIDRTPPELTQLSPVDAIERRLRMASENIMAVGFSIADTNPDVKLEFSAARISRDIGRMIKEYSSGESPYNVSGAESYLRDDFIRLGGDNVNVAISLISELRSVIAEKGWFEKYGKVYDFKDYSDLLEHRLRGLLFQDSAGGTHAGGVQFLDNQKAIVKAFTADGSTFTHEFGHILRRDLYRTFEESKLDWIKADIDTLEQHFGVANGDWSQYANKPDWISSRQDDTWKSPEEAFARTWEKYLADGQAPTSALQQVFEHFKSVMIRVYHAIVGSQIDVKMSDEVRQVFDRLIAERDDSKQLEPEPYPAPAPTPDLAPDVTGQGDMFGNGAQDTPLFSGTPQRAQDQVFTPQEPAPQQGAMLGLLQEASTRKAPINQDWGVKLIGKTGEVTFNEKPTADIAAELRKNGMMESDMFGLKWEGTRESAKAFADAQDKRNPVAKGLTSDRGFVLPDGPEKETITPEVKATEIPALRTREGTLFAAMNDRIANQQWFPKSRDFEAFIKNMGYDLDNSIDLNQAYDIMEGSFNIRAREIRAELIKNGASRVSTLQAMAELESHLPEARRTLEKMEKQQFSTPLTLSEAAGWAADVRPGDIIGEPTAGTANLVDRFSGRSDVTVKVNEIDSGRIGVMRLLGYDPTELNLMKSEWLIQGGKRAEQFANIVISNPPWGSYSTGKYGEAVNDPVKMNDWSQRFAYLTLKRMPEDGRYVGVMPTNWLYTMDRVTRQITIKKSAFYSWLENNYSVRAVIESPPGAYKQRGTDVSSLLIVIDKTPHAFDNVNTIESYAHAQPQTWGEYANEVSKIPNRTQEAITHGHEQFKPIIAGPDASGIIDPNARAGISESDGARIGEPTERTSSATRTSTNTTPTQDARPSEQQPSISTVSPDGERVGGDGQVRSGILGLPGERDTINANEPGQPGIPEGRAASPIILEGNAPAVSEPNKPRVYSDAFTKRLLDAQDSVRNSTSFARYMERAPLRDGEVSHPHPSVIVETKGLSSVPYPELEEAYRPSPSVMRAMDSRALSHGGNIDPIWQAVQQNDKHHMGILIADDVGMGKSRTAAGFVIDRIEKGKNKILVVTKGEQNVLNLQDEFRQVYSGKADENGAYTTGVPNDFPAKFINLTGQNKSGEAIPVFDTPTVYFTTETSFRYYEPLLKDIGLDVFVADEAHMFKKVDKGTKYAVAWADLHKNLLSRDASIMYLTATPGIDLSELQYLYGLRAWSMDGFGDWIKIITGQESADSIKAKQKSMKNVDAYVQNLQSAVELLDTPQVKKSLGYGVEQTGKQVGNIGVFYSDRGKGKESVLFEVNGEGYDAHLRSETQGILVAKILGENLAGLDMNSLQSWEIHRAIGKASEDFSMQYPEPSRAELQSVGIKDASDVIAKSDKGGWGKKGLSAFEVTLPPAHIEQIMREMKVAGSYMSRDISRSGVEFNVSEYKPNIDAKAIYNKRVEFYRELYTAWKKFSKFDKSGKAGAFGVNGDIQADAKRALFNMRLPGIIEEAKKAIANGEQVVISIISVGGVDEESGSLFGAVNNKINTQKVDSLGHGEYSSPEEIPEAVLARLDLLDKLKELTPMPSPIDAFTEAFRDRIDFVHGKVDTNGRRRASKDFQNNKLDVIVISGAGKTGINLHDITGKRRVHLIVGDYEWSASTFKQELGRVDRTGQLTAPKVTVMHTGSAGEKKFVATISNRMKGVGAVSKGGADSTGTGAMTDVFELGSALDKVALSEAWRELSISDRSSFLDHFFYELGMDAPRATLEGTSNSLSKFLLGLQSIEIDKAEEIFKVFENKRTELLAQVTEVDDTAKASATTGEIIRQVDLAQNLRMSEVRNQAGQKFAVLDGVLTPHMNTLRGIDRNLQDISYQELQAMNASGGDAWARWVQFYDPEKNAYATGLKINPGKIKDVAEHFGRVIGSTHTPENATVDIRAGDRIKVKGANLAEWELYQGKAGSREGKIVIDGAKVKDKETLMTNGAGFNAIGGFFFVPEDKLIDFLKRFPINNDEQPTEAAKPKILYQDQATTEPVPGPMSNDATLPVGGMAGTDGYVPEAQIYDEAFSKHLIPALEAMRSAYMAGGEKQFKFGDLDSNSLAALQKYLRQVKSEMPSAKLSTLRWGEIKRDAALLNYTRRTKAGQVADAIWPYRFWATNSASQWAMRAIDKPTWATNYYRLRQAQQTYQTNEPDRMKGKLRIAMPGLPAWAGGGLYVDPLKQLFPFANLLTPFESMQREAVGQDRNAEYIIRRWMRDGNVDETTATQALTEHTGNTWERAMTQVKQETTAEIANPLDFMNVLMGPALYITAPLNALGIKTPFSSGDPKDISPLPITRTGQNIKTALSGTPFEGIGNAAGLLAKPEEWIRNKAGLSQFGGWGDYYIDRQIANLVAEGYPLKLAQVATNERQGPIYDEAVRRVQQEQMLKQTGTSALYFAARGNMNAINPALLFSGSLLPQGELEIRGDKEPYNKAWEAYKAGDKQALTNFFNEHPEYEARLALFDTPEERLRQFIISEIWDKYNSLDRYAKNEASNTLGNDFKTSFRNKETRAPENVKIDQLALWAKLLNGYVPGSELKPLGGVSPQTYNQEPAQLPDPKFSGVMTDYYNERDSRYPDYYIQGNEYYALPERSASRKTYLLKHPELVKYWDWNRAYKEQHPEIQLVNDMKAREVDLSTFNSLLIKQIKTLSISGVSLTPGAEKMLYQQWIDAGKPGSNADEWLKTAVLPAVAAGQ